MTGRGSKNLTEPLHVVEDEEITKNTLFVEYGFLIAGRLRPSGRGRFFCAVGEGGSNKCYKYYR